MIDLYEQLGISGEATPVEIQAAIETARLILSDDSEDQNRTDIKRKMTTLDFAERVLANEQSRQDYDNSLKYSANSTANQNAVVIVIEDVIDEAWSLLSNESSIAQAVAHAEHATLIEPENVRALGILAYGNRKWGRLDEALRIIKLTLQLAPLDSASHCILASIYKEKERYAEAIEAFERSFALDPASKEVYGVDYCHCLWSTRQFEKSVAFLEAELQRDPDKQDTVDSLATSYCLLIPQKWTQLHEHHWTQQEGLKELDVFPVDETYLTTRAQVETSISLLEKAKRLNTSDDVVRTLIKELAKKILYSVERSRHGSIVSPIIGGIIWTIIYGFGIILVPAYFVAARSPGYLITRDWYDGEHTNDEDASYQKGGDKVASYVVNGIGLPVFVVRNYLKNYTGEQKGLEPLIQRARNLCVGQPHQA